MAQGRKPGSPKTGGRQKGAQNKAPIARARAIEASGLTPLEFMIEMMRRSDLPEDFRLDAAKAAAPYVHPKLTSVELKGDPNAPIEHHLTIDAFTSRIARLVDRRTTTEE